MQARTSAQAKSAVQPIVVELFLELGQQLVLPGPLMLGPVRPVLFEQGATETGLGQAGEPLIQVKGLKVGLPMPRG